DPPPPRFGRRGGRHPRPAAAGPRPNGPRHHRPRPHGPAGEAGRHGGARLPARRAAALGRPRGLRRAALGAELPPPGSGGRAIRLGRARGRARGAAAPGGGRRAARRAGGAAPDCGPAHGLARRCGPPRGRRRHAGRVPPEPGEARVRLGGGGRRLPDPAPARRHALPPVRPPGRWRQRAGAARPAGRLHHALGHPAAGRGRPGALGRAPRRPGRALRVPGRLRLGGGAGPLRPRRRADQAHRPRPLRARRRGGHPRPRRPRGGVHDRPAGGRLPPPLRVGRPGDGRGGARCRHALGGAVAGEPDRLGARAAGRRGGGGRLAARHPRRPRPRSHRAALGAVLPRQPRPAVGPRHRDLGRGRRRRRALRFRPPALRRRFPLGGRAVRAGGGPAAGQRVARESVGGGGGRARARLDRHGPCRRGGGAGGRSLRLRPRRTGARRAAAGVWRAAGRGGRRRGADPGRRGAVRRRPPPRRRARRALRAAGHALARIRPRRAAAQCPARVPARGRRAGGGV
ncbi:MAG: Putative phosphatase, partial [uncultured Acetobacteraceae bacterium]